MDLRKILLEIAEGWPEFHALKKDDKSHPIHQLVVREFPDAMYNAITDQTELKCEGSVGRGVITYAPWMACFHTSLTSSAQDESV